jgi:hypothetical protein
MRCPKSPDPLPFVIVAIATSIIGFVLDKIFDRED